MSELFHCRACGSSQGRLVLDLGIQPLANNLLRPADLSQPEPKFPLRLFVCGDCRLLQIADDVAPVKLFGEYLYFSSFSDLMLRHAREAVERYIRDFGLGPNNRVVEIASNDGYLLKNFVQAGIPCLGIEPAANIAREAVSRGIPTRVEFFGSALAQTLVTEKQGADLILGNNVFAHAPAINDFVEGLKILLKPGGRVILEFPYALDLIEKIEFDTIYHEHVFYFTLSALRPVFQQHGLVIHHVEKLPIHGGSLRLFATHSENGVPDATVDAFLKEENRRGVNADAYYQGFSERVMGLKADLNQLLKQLKAEGKTIAAYGASAKGSTLLNYFGLGTECLDFVVDRSSYKQGRLTPGTHIPILPPEQLLARQPDYTLLLTWNFADEILEQQREYRQRGGQFIIPIPEVKIVP
jgi:SAM-dependent methyltransferase